ncbi:PREDICTED: uncharacterized protein LOC104741108 [Camelina sativa]|uniref:Uncharacterized protein LOC104741108 n=1 Tax=Camelina sativa TaxID=90675 RepID=A0ABM0VRS7_CAMSA|nr:PREDICTED: uncharacterized protein LOC104741108 [Camelina sativa]
MAVSFVSSIIFFLLFIKLSLFVDGNVFAARMEHRKLGGAKKTMAMRRNLDENGHQGSKIAAHGSTSRHSGQKTTNNTPSEIRPNRATPQRKKYMSMTDKALQLGAVCKEYTYNRCKRSSSAP